MQVAPKVVKGVVCLMKSKIYNVLGSIAMGNNALKPHTIAVDMSSGYNLLRKSDLSPDWTCHIVRDVSHFTRCATANVGEGEQ